MNSNHLLLHLSLISQVGPATVQKLIGIKNSEDIYQFSVHDFMHLFHIQERVAQVLVKGLAQKDILYKELELLAHHNVQWLSILDDEYPALLKHIHMPPIGLYIRGKLTHESTHVSIVGSRMADTYAQKVLANLIPDLIACGCVIVSGGARGVDTMAHTIALEYGGTTIAILGSGLLRPYPFQNRDLFDRIVEQGGLVMSPFALNQEPLPGNFPARNRIISGVSVGCLVVQAHAKSGALITAGFALEQGREVFAIPGLMVDPLSAGCHALIKEGATLVTCSNDILTALGFSEVSTQQIAKKIDTASKISDSDSELLILCKEPISIDDLVIQTGMPLGQVQSQLFDLQLKNKLSQNFSGLWFSC